METKNKLNIKNLFIIVKDEFRYSMKIIFGNKFIYFLLASVIFFLIVTTINLFSTSDFTEGGVYYLLLFPGILLIFILRLSEFKTTTICECSKTFSLFLITDSKFGFRASE